MSKNISEDISEKVYLRIIPRLRRSHKRVDGEFDDERAKLRHGDFSHRTVTRSQRYKPCRPGYRSPTNMNNDRYTNSQWRYDDCDYLAQGVATNACVICLETVRISVNTFYLPPSSMKRSSRDSTVNVVYTGNLIRETQRPNDFCPSLSDVCFNLRMH